MAKFWPSQNFPGIYTMIFSKTTRVVFIPKIMKIYSGVRKIQAKNFRSLKTSEEPKRNKTQYDWLPGKTQNSRSLVQNLSKIKQRLKIITILTFWEIKIPQRITTTFGGQNNIKNEFSTVEILNVQIFSKISQLLKIKISQGFLTFQGVKMPPGGHNNFLGSKFHQKWIQHLQITQSANFHQNPTTFKKSLSYGGFLTFGG